MKQMRARLLLLPILCILLIGGSSGREQIASSGPVSNGSFERVTDGVPAGWERYDKIGAGSIAQDQSTYRSGSSSLRIGQVVGLYGVASEKLPFYPWQKSLAISTWVKAQSAGKFDIWLVWYKKDNVVKISRAQTAAGTYDWKEAVLNETQPPQGAGRYQIVLLSETSVGNLWLDDVSASLASDVRTEILVNQIGYRTDWPKTFLVQSSSSLQPGSFELIDGNGATVYSGATVAAGTPDGWPYAYLRGDFSAFTTPGSYRIRISQGGQPSYAFAIAANPYADAEDLARQFYYYQRCGAKIAGWHGYCHLDDGDLSGTHYPIIGGWHEAGDYIKSTVGQPLSLLALSRLASRRTAASSYGKLIDETKWGATFIGQFTSPTTGRALAGVFNRKFYWGPPESETDNVPGGSDDREVREAAVNQTDNQLVAAGLALTSSLISRPDYLAKAEDLWEQVHDQVPGDSNALGRLLILETVLYEKTGNAKYATEAHIDIDTMISLQQGDGGFQRFNVTDRGLPAASLAFWASTFPRDSHTPRIKAALKRFLRWVNRLNKNPFRLMVYDESSFFFPYQAIGDFILGENSDYLSVAWATALSGKVVGLSKSNKRIIQSHLDWIMGKNPFGVCMIEGAGSYNPAIYHHRFDTLPGHSDGAVPGAIVNGLIRESIDSPAPRFDVLGNMFETNEPWLPHNAYFLLLMAELS